MSGSTNVMGTVQVVSEAGGKSVPEGRQGLEDHAKDGQGNVELLQGFIQGGDLAKSML